MSRLGDALVYLVGRGVFAARSKAPLVTWITLSTGEYDSLPSSELVAFDATIHDTCRNPCVAFVDYGLMSVDRTTDVIHSVLVADSVEMHTIPHLGQAWEEPSLDASAHATAPGDSCGGAPGKPVSDHAEVSQEARPTGELTRTADNETSARRTTLRLPSLSSASNCKRRKRTPAPAEEVFSLMRQVLNITPRSPEPGSGDHGRRNPRRKKEAAAGRRPVEGFKRRNPVSEVADPVLGRNTSPCCPVVQTWIDIDQAFDSSTSVAPQQAANDPSVAVA